MKKLTILLVMLSCLLTACTQQERARHMGGTSTTVLPKGHKFVVATWKEDSLWVLTRVGKPGEVPETYTFQEESAYDVMEGTVLIKEQ